MAEQKELMKVLADRGVKDQKQQLEAARSILAQEKLIEEAAKKANIAQDPAVKALIAERKTEIYSAELVRKNAAAHPLTDADLKKTYEEVKSNTIRMKSKFVTSWLKPSRKPKTSLSL